MSTPKVIGWKDVKKMLDECAAGWTEKDKDHRKWISWAVKACTILPLGPHGNRKSQNYHIPSGKVRNLVWTLGIDHECAARSLGIPVAARP